MIKRALISVSDKTGLVEFGRGLAELGVEILSTGGTAKKLIDAGVSVIKVSDFTGFPEILDGRVKTLQPQIHGGILARRNLPEHMQQLEELNIASIDMVVVNLYPFKATIAKDGVTMEDAIENIDIGGPTMIRSAAKNYEHVTVVVNHKQYDEVLSQIKETGDVSLDFKAKLAMEAFSHTGEYDAIISNFLAERIGEELFPNTLNLTFEKVSDLRYGENSHQQAAFYAEPLIKEAGMATVEQLQGKAMSFNNYNDANAALEIIKEFRNDRPCVVGLKHTNPCGVGVADSLLEAYQKAYEGDSTSIFGGIVAVNRPLDKETAEALKPVFLEVILAPAFSDEALQVLKSKKNLRLLKVNNFYEPAEKSKWDLKRLSGGILVQQRDQGYIPTDEIKIPTKTKPDKEMMTDLLFAEKIVKHVKSNAIVVVKDQKILGVGAGQMNRVGAAKIALEWAGEKACGAILASDAFFPFSDTVETAAKYGISAIVQPGGSIRDQESIDKCDELGLAMIFTGRRHFKH